LFSVNILNARFNDLIEVFVLISVGTMMLSFTSVTNDGIATSRTLSSSNVTETVQLGPPFYEEHYKANLGKPETLKSSGNFTGEGILNGNLTVSAEVNYTRTFRDNDTAFVQGNTKFVTEANDTASYSYNAYTNYNPGGTSEGTGTALFSDGATGDLSFLSDTLAIYKIHVDGSSNGTFLMWQWK
jgi:hypothetical protein